MLPQRTVFQVWAEVNSIHLGLSKDAGLLTDFTVVERKDICRPPRVTGQRPKFAALRVPAELLTPDSSRISELEEFLSFQCLVFSQRHSGQIPEAGQGEGPPSCVRRFSKDAASLTVNPYRAMHLMPWPQPPDPYSPCHAHRSPTRPHRWHALTLRAPCTAACQSA
jgi:hypothetical protein